MQIADSPLATLTLWLTRFVRSMADGSVATLTLWLTADGTLTPFALWHRARSFHSLYGRIFFPYAISYKATAGSGL